MLKCQCLTSVVDVWKGEFDTTKYVFCSASVRQNLYIELTFNKKERVNFLSCCSSGKRKRECLMTLPLWSCVWMLLLVEVNLVVLDAAWGTLLCAWEVFQGSDGLLAAEVDDEKVGQGCALLCLPVG